MSYLTQDTIANNAAMLARVAQCAAQQMIPTADEWTRNNRRTWASAPGWDAAWESALAGGIEDPGSDEAVITDGMILSQVQSMMANPQ